MREALNWVLEGTAYQMEWTPNLTLRFLTDSGFSERNTRGKKVIKAPVTELEMPTNLIAVNVTKPGCAKLTWDESKNAINYAIRFKPKAESIVLYKL